MDNKSFLGHSKKVTCLSVSVDDFTMASGSEDTTIRIWDTLSRQCVKIISNSGKSSFSLTCCVTLQSYSKCNCVYFASLTH